MANITLKIPDSLHEQIRRHSEIRWSEVIRQILQKKLEQLEQMERIASKSKLTERDVEEIGRKIKTGIAKRHSLIK